MAIKEENGIESLILSGRGDVPLNSQMREEGFYLSWPHFLGMALVMEEDVSCHPADIGNLGAYAVMFDSQNLPCSIQQLFWLRFALNIDKHFAVLHTQLQHKEIIPQETPCTLFP